MEWWNHGKKIQNTEDRIKNKIRMLKKEYRRQESEDRRAVFFFAEHPIIPMLMNS